KKRKESPALHVIDAGTVGNIAGDAKGQALDEAQGMHRVEMGEHENAWVGAAPARARDQMVAKAVAPGNALYPSAARAIGALDVIDHAVEGCPGGGGALDLAPGPELGEHARRFKLRLCHFVPRFLPALPRLLRRLLSRLLRRVMQGSRPPVASRRA